MLTVCYVAKVGMSISWRNICYLPWLRLLLHAGMCAARPILGIEIRLGIVRCLVSSQASLHEGRASSEVFAGTVRANYGTTVTKHCEAHDMSLDGFQPLTFTSTLYKHT